MGIGITLLIVNIFIGFTLVYIIRKQDYYHPEPLRQMILATLVGGILSIGMTLAAVMTYRRC